MYFNDNSNSTNIDQEFNDKKKFNFDFFLRNKLIFGIILGVLIIIIIFILIPKNKNKYYLVLKGSENIVIYQNSPYIDEGYDAYDSKGNNYSDNVIVNNNVNTEVVGEYVIDYTFNDIVKTRKVTVISDTKHITYLVLSGETLMYLKVGEEYKEPGYTVIDSEDATLKDKVKIVGEVDTSRAGTYKLTYSVQNMLGLTTKVERTVIVMGSDISITYDNTIFKNDYLNINLAVTDNYFDYILLPDGTKDYKRITTYKVTNNGNYVFKIYNKDNTYTEKGITINNIDINSPNGTCNAVYKNNTYTISSNVSDDISGIKNIEYYVNNRLINNTKDTKITINQSKTDNIKIISYDNAGNKKEIICNIDNSAYVAPKPSSESSSSSKPSSSSKSSSSSKPSSSSSKYNTNSNTNTGSNNSNTNTGSNNTTGSGSCGKVAQSFTVTLNGQKVSRDQKFTMKVGETLRFRMVLPSNCGKTLLLTRTTADGQEGWRNYFTGKSDPYVNRNDSSTFLARNDYYWVITAKKKTSNYIILSQTAFQKTSLYSEIKSMYTIQIKVV